jgi:uracil-DNA glycosylase family 4
MFTGDRSGDFLFRALHEAGLANRPDSVRRDDGLRLLGCAITSAAHCAPPGNRPTPEELALCAEYLEETVRLLPRIRAILALGGIAFEACVRLYRSRGWLGRGDRPRFGHGAACRAGEGPPLFASYHPSQQNTFTGRLTMPMLVGVLESASRAAAPPGAR